MTQEAISGPRTPSESGGSRPSKNNRTSASQPGHDAIFPDLEETRPLSRPLSVIPGTKLREDAVVKRQYDDLPQTEFIAKSWGNAVCAWRSWIRDYAKSHLRYRDPEGEVVRAPLENSYQDRYGKRYYARFKDLERAVVEEFEDPHVALLTFTASNKNANGGYRCPCDHLRNIVDTWNAGVRQELHRAMGSRTWEYARILEPHKMGYGHVHIAVFVDGEVKAKEFRDVMSAHTRNCDPASKKAHRVHGKMCDPDDHGAVSISAIEPGSKHGDAYADDEPVSNLGTYLCEYLGSHGDPLEQPPNVQMFYAACWASNTRRLDFSNGAQDMIRRQSRRRESGTRPEDRGDGDDHAEVEVDAEAEEVTVNGPGKWTVDAMVRGEPEGAEDFALGDGGIVLKTITGNPDIDPPPKRN